MASKDEKKPAAPSANEAAPDPDEDDLDDLDDMLDEFSSVKLENKQSQPLHAIAPTTSGPGRPPQPPTIGGGLDEDEFAKQLQAGMATLLGEMESNPQMKKEFEEMLKGFEPAPASSSTSTTSQKPSSTTHDESFQDKIRQTMDRMTSSSEQASAAAASADSDDMLARMLKEMQGSGFDGGGSEEEFNKMLMGMMEQLTNKEILYEPMKELNEKFPAWMEKNRDTVAKDDLTRYEEQQHLVGEIVGRFERKGYSDDNATDREFIVERMQKMQAAGSPPADLVGDMNGADEALGALDSGCPQQ